MMVFCLLAVLPQQGRSTGYYVGFKLYRNFGAYGAKILVPQARFSDAKTRLQLILIHRPQLPYVYLRAWRLKSNMALILRLRKSAVDGSQEVLKTSPLASPYVAGVAGRIPDPPP